MEKLKYINGTYKRYKISNTGKVYSLYERNSKKPLEQPRQKATFINNAGYECVLLSIKGKVKSCTIHRLVALHFIENPYKLSDVNHKDENKLNNCVENLEWVSHKQNMQYSAYRWGESIINGWIISNFLNPEKLMREIISNATGYEFNENDYRPNGSIKYKTKRINQFDSNGNIIREFKDLQQAAEYFNLSVARISQLCHSDANRRKIFLRYSDKKYQN